jgi:hypothetical protein
VFAKKNILFYNTKLFCDFFYLTRYSRGGTALLKELYVRRQHSKIRESKEIKLPEYPISTKNGLSRSIFSRSGMIQAQGVKEYGKSTGQVVGGGSPFLTPDRFALSGYQSSTLTGCLLRL